MEERELEELRAKFIKNNTPEKLEARLRKISLENQSNMPAHLVFSFIGTDDSEPYIQDHYIPEHDSGWIPYFVSGILNIEYNNQKLSIDITQPRKEYKLRISPNYLITSSIHELENY